MTPPRPSIPAALTMLATLLVALLIAVMTLSSASGAAPVPGADKLAHAAAFALLVLPMGWRRPAALTWLAPLALAYGGVIELVQPHVGRSAEWADLAADGVGIALGVLLSRLHRRRRA